MVGADQNKGLEAARPEDLQAVDAGIAPEEVVGRGVGHQHWCCQQCQGGIGHVVGEEGEVVATIHERSGGTVVTGKRQVVIDDAFTYEQDVRLALPGIELLAVGRDVGTGSRLSYLLVYGIASVVLQRQVEGRQVHQLCLPRKGQEQHQQCARGGKRLVAKRTTRALCPQGDEPQDDDGHVAQDSQEVIGDEAATFRRIRDEHRDDIHRLHVVTVHHNHESLVAGEPHQGNAQQDEEPIGTHRCQEERQHGAGQCNEQQVGIRLIPIQQGTVDGCCTEHQEQREEAEQIPPSSSLLCPRTLRLRIVSHCGSYVLLPCKDSTFV